MTRMLIFGRYVAQETYYLLQFNRVRDHLVFFFPTIQAAVYGIGVCAEFGGSVFRPLVGGSFIHTFFVSPCLRGSCCIGVNAVIFSL